MSSRSESKRPGRARRRLLKWGLGTLAALVILAAVLVGLFRVAANVVPGYHDEIVRRISTSIGSPVQMGRVSLVWHGWGPALAFNHLKVLNPKTGKAVLSAERLRLDFTLPSLIHGLEAKPSAISLQSPSVTLRQMPDGSIVVPGLSLSTDGGNGLSALLDSSIEVSSGKISLYLADEAPWKFTSIDVSVGGGKTHAIHLSLRLPKALGGHRLHVNGQVTTGQPEPGQWQWALHYALQQLPLATLDKFVPADWKGLHGSLTLKGQAQGVGADLHRAQGELSLNGLSGGANRLESLRTRYALAIGSGFELTLNNSVLVGSQHTWEPGRIGLGRDRGGRIHLSASHIDVALLPTLSGLLPTSLDSLARRLHELQPAGSVHDLSLSLQPGQIGSMALAAKLDDIGLRPASGLPGVSHLSGHISMHHGMGIFMLDAPGLTLFLPGIFSRPVPLDQARGRIAVALTGEGVRVATPHLDIRGPAGLDAWAMATIDVPDQGPVVIHLAAIQPGMLDAVAARPLYIPASLLPDALVHWLMTQLDGGQVGNASVRFIGPVLQFPFYQNQGLFSVRFGYRDVTLKPGKGWTALKNLSGSIHFKNEGMRGTVRSGSIVNATVKHARIIIPDLADPLLTVTTTVAGSIDDFITFLKNSPVGEKVAYGFNHFKAEGAARTHLQLTLPALHPEQFKLAGQFTLKHGTLKFTGQPYALQHMNGQLRFDRLGPVSGHMRGLLLDTPIEIGFSRRHNSDNESSLHIGMHGDFPVAALREVMQFDLSPYASGYLPLQASITLPLVGVGLPLDINLTSNLRGLAVNLPAPAGKPVHAARPLMLKAHVMREGIRLEARYADVGSFCTLITQRDEQLVLPVAEVKLGNGRCQLPQRGYYLVGGWPLLRTKAWLNVVSRVVSPSAASSPSAFSGPLFSTAHDLTAKVHFGRIKLFGRGIQDQSIVAQLYHNQLKVQLKGPDLAGTLLIPSMPDNSSPILVYLDKAHFSAPPAAPAKSPPTATTPAPTAMTRQQVVADNSEEQNDLRPRDIPPFDLHVTSLKVGQALFKGVEVSARRVPHGVVIKPIRVADGVLSLNGQLVWLHPAKGSQGAFQMLAHVHDLGALLQGLGMGKIITGHGAVSAALAWHQPPKGGQFAQGLLGKVSMDLREGNISKVNPGAGRLLSLLNLVNIPGYLVLDFHNVFGEGFPFNRIYGDYHIKQGIARTKAFRIESSVADIKLVGAVNLVQGRIDQTAYVRPNYFGSLPVIGALVGGLGVGAAIFVLAKIFGNPIGKALELAYSIEGPITHPTVKPIDADKPVEHQTAPAPASAGAQ